MKISIAKQEAAQRQAAFEAERRRYEVEKQRYDSRVAEYEKENERQSGLSC
jgi:hypothetical protein